MNESMRRLVFDTPAQLAWALDLEPPRLAAAHDVVLVGMGGSAMAAEAAALAVGDGGILAHVHRGYGLPEWAVDRRATVVACSYSGNTEETVSSVEAARDAGLPVVAVTSGGEIGSVGDIPTISVPEGLQPRAAFGYQTGAVICALAGVGAVDEVAATLTPAIEVMEGLLGDGRGAAVALGEDIADAMQHVIPLVVGGRGVAATAARRWSTQISENAKRLAFFAEVPELNHNLLEAMAGSESEPGRVGVVALHDPAGPERHRTRVEHTMVRLGGKVHSSGEVRAQGRHPLARLFSLVIVGDIASVALADLLEVEAEPVAVLEDFKRAIASREDHT